MAAAAIVTAWTGHSLTARIRPVWRLRVPVRWWLYSLGLPALLYAVVTLVLQLIGSPVDWSLAVDRLPAYLSTFVFVLFLGGALEEPGWRGFGLPVLQERYSPLRATLILGLARSACTRLRSGGIRGPLRAGLLLHPAVERHPQRGAVHPDARQLHSAQDHFILMPQEQAYTSSLDAPDWVILGTYVAAALVVVAVTHGRLGHRGTPPSSHRSLGSPAQP